MEYKDMKIEDIINWCVEHKEVKWLKEKAQEKREFKVYPKVEKDGKMVADKTQEPVIEMRPISFVQLKKDFTEKFMPEIAPKKNKKPNMFELIAELED
jgi:hypothetical protein